MGQTCRAGGVHEKRYGEMEVCKIKVCKIKAS